MKKQKTKKYYYRFIPMEKDTSVRRGLPNVEYDIYASEDDKRILDVPIDDVIDNEGSLSLIYYIGTFNPSYDGEETIEIVEKFIKRIMDNQ